MLKITKFIGYVGAALTLGVGSFAMAAGVLDADLGVGVNSNTSVRSGGSSASANGQANMSATGTARSSEAGSKPSTTAKEGNNAVDLNFSPGKSGITITRSDVDGNAGVTVTMSSSVNDDASLNSYIKSEVKENAEVSSVSSSDDQIEVKYKKPAKFLGIFPIKSTVTVTADSKGNVEVHYPWYRFLIAIGKKVDLQTSVESKVSASGNISGTTAASKARIIEAIVSALNASANASAETNSSTDVSY